MRPEVLKIGVVGLGQQGSFYTKLFQGAEIRAGVTLPKLLGGELVAVSDMDPQKLEEISGAFPHLACFNDYKDMLDNADVDAVLIATPHYFHPSMAIEAMQRDIHVLVDKPAGVFTNDVQKMNDFSCAKPELQFSMMFNQRCNLLYRKMKDIIDSGVIGAVRYTDWTITTWWRPQSYYDLSAWRATWAGEGGGVLINQAPHQIDLWQWICGMPSTVYAKAGYGSQRDIAVEDDVVALVTYDNGATGVFRTCTHDMLGTDRFEILGDKGKIVVEGSSKIVLKKLVESENVISQGIAKDEVSAILQGVASIDQYFSEETFEFESEWGKQHFDVIQNFLDAINHGSELVAEGAEGINALSITNAIHLSSWLDREVSLPIDGDLFEAELNKRIQQEIATAP